MTNPVAVIDAIDADAVRLGELESLIGDAVDLLDAAEEAWDEALDATAEAMREEYRSAGRKMDPAEHTILSEARRQNRLAYTNWRRAKRAVEKFEKQMKARQAALSGRQSQLSGLRDEARAPARDPRLQPHWTGSQS